MFRMNLVATGEFTVRVGSGRFSPLETQIVFVVAGKDASLSNIRLTVTPTESTVPLIDIAKSHRGSTLSGVPIINGTRHRLAGSGIGVYSRPIS